MTLVLYPSLRNLPSQKSFLGHLNDLCPPTHFSERALFPQGFCRLYFLSSWSLLNSASGEGSSIKGREWETLPGVTSEAFNNQCRISTNDLPAGGPHGLGSAGH